MAADQGRWFKLWVSAPSDDKIIELAPALRWAWAALGCHIKQHGDNGQIVISLKNAVLAAKMGVETESLKYVIKSLPNVVVIRETDAVLAISWTNWRKYQEDTTDAARARKARAKKAAQMRWYREHERERTDAATSMATSITTNRPQACDGAPVSIGNTKEIIDATVTVKEEKRRDEKRDLKIRSDLEPSARPTNNKIPDRKSVRGPSGKFRVEDQPWAGSAFELIQSDREKYKTVYSMCGKWQHKWGVPADVIASVLSGIGKYCAEVPHWEKYAEQAVLKRWEKTKVRAFEAEHEKIKQAEAKEW